MSIMMRARQPRWGMKAFEFDTNLVCASTMGDDMCAAGLCGLCGRHNKHMWDARIFVALMVYDGEL